MMEIRSSHIAHLLFCGRGMGEGMRFFGMGRFNLFITNEIGRETFWPDGAVPVLTCSACVCWDGLDEEQWATLRANLEKLDIALAGERPRGAARGINISAMKQQLSKLRREAETEKTASRCLVPQN